MSEMKTGLAGPVGQGCMEGEEFGFRCAQFEMPSGHPSGRGESTIGWMRPGANVHVEFYGTEGQSTCRIKLKIYKKSNIIVALMQHRLK